MNLDLARALEVATAAALEAGALLRAEFHRDGGPRHAGEHHAEVDEEAEGVIRRALLGAFPEIAYVGEETGSHGSGPACWFVDPNDGTRAFIHGWRGSAVSIALVAGGQPRLGVVYAPLAPTDAGDLITWAEGGALRRNGAVVRRAPFHSEFVAGDVVLVSQDADRSAPANATLLSPARFIAVPSIAYRLALVAVGEGEAGVSLNSPVAWDFAGGHALLLGAGGQLVGVDGKPIRYREGGAGSRYVVGGHPKLAADLATRDWEKVLARRDRSSSEPSVLSWPSHARKVRDTGVLSRAQGCLLGQLAGDALGQLVEFESASAIVARYASGVRTLRDGGTWDTIAGQPTDDSEMALSLARSILAQGGFEAEHVREAYVAWFRSGPFDMGGTTSAGLSGRPILESQANGSLMRVSPLAIFGHALEPEALAKLAHADSKLTHPNPVCCDSVAVFCVAAAHAIRSGSGAREAWQFALDWARAAKVEPSVLRTLSDAEHRPPADYEHQQGWVLTALGNAFFRLLHSVSLEEGVVETVGCGGDTDTNGAIAGALLGAVHGAGAVPRQWRQAVLSCLPVGGRRPRPRQFWTVDALIVAEQLAALGQAGH